MMSPAAAQEAPAGWESGRAAFNRGEYFRAHELWEELWLALAPPPAANTRSIVQGLIQIAAGCHHLQNNRPGPAARLLAKGADKLQSPPPPFADAAALRAFAASARKLATTLTAPNTPRSFPAALIL